MTIQLLYYIKLFNPDKTTVYNQIPFFVYANSFKDIVDQVERFVADDYVKYMRKTYGDFLDLNMVQMKGLKQKQNLNITSKMKTEGQ